MVTDPSDKPELSGTFQGSVAVGGGEAVDMRETQGALYKPSSPVTQHFGNVIQVNAPIATSLHQLPPPPTDFTGREAELVELRAALETGDATIFGLRGMSGVGKTVLALKLAEELVPRYPDAQFYLNLLGTTQPLTPGEAMAHVIRVYHPTEKLPES